MARIFLSLYVFIALALIFLSTILDPFFYSEDQIQSSESVAIRTLLNSLARSGFDMTELSAESGLHSRIISLDDMSWNDKDKQALISGDTISLFDPSLGQQFYLMYSDNQLVEITFRQNEQKSSPFLLYSAIFYALLGGLVALWVWPLWRDLNIVKQGLSKLSNSGSIEKITVAQGSLVRPIADAINNLSTQVTQLMLTQRELTGAVAHELRTPLSRLKFALAIKPEPGTSQWEAMSEDVDELEKLVQEMLNFTSMEAHEPELNMSEIPLLTLCKQIAESSIPQNSGINVRVEGNDYSVLADEHYLHRAIENLFLNAIRHAHTTVLISLHGKPKALEIHVDDDGSGIKPEWQEKIFEPFFRPDEGRDRKCGGAGLGLAIVKRIVQWHQGNCWATQSELGGARLVVRLPYRHSSSAQSNN